MTRWAGVTVLSLLLAPRVEAAGPLREWRDTFGGSVNTPGIQNNLGPRAAARLRRAAEPRSNAGLHGLYELAERRFGVRKPTLIVNVLRYLEDRWKKNQLTDTGAIRFTR